MLIRLQSVEIHKYWEAIKFGAAKADGVRKDQLATFAIELLLDLLNDRSQCIVSIKDNKIVRLIIVSFMINPIANKKVMIIKSLYSFSGTSREEWLQEFEQVCGYAKRQECDLVTMTSGNPVVIDMLNDWNLEQDSINYSFKL